jgi:hypothetical protein
MSSTNVDDYLSFLFDLCSHSKNQIINQCKKKKQIIEFLFDYITIY